MNPNEILTRLHRLPVFASLTSDEALALAKKCRIALYRAGSIVFREGEYGDSLMIVVKGSVRIVCKAEENVNIEVATLTEGSFFGEMAIFDPAPRSASATALTETVLLLLDSKTLEDLMLTNNPAASRIMQNILRVLASRFRTMDEQIERLFVHRLGVPSIRLCERDYSRKRHPPSKG